MCVEQRDEREKERDESNSGVLEGGEKKKRKETPPTGLEPATPGLGGRCHIH